METFMIRPLICFTISVQQYSTSGGTLREATLIAKVGNWTFRTRARFERHLKDRLPRQCGGLPLPSKDDCQIFVLVYERDAGVIL
jgi:hypothetical protein